MFFISFDINLKFGMKFESLDEPSFETQNSSESWISLIEYSNLRNYYNRSLDATTFYV